MYIIKELLTRMLLQVESVFALFYLSRTEEKYFNTNRTRIVTWKFFDFSFLTIGTIPPAVRSWLLCEMSNSSRIFGFEKVKGRSMY